MDEAYEQISSSRVNKIKHLSLESEKKKLFENNSTRNEKNWFGEFDTHRILKATVKERNTE